MFVGLNFVWFYFDKALMGVFKIETFEWVSNLVKANNLTTFF